LSATTSARGATLVVNMPPVRLSQPVLPVVLFALAVVACNANTPVSSHGPLSPSTVRGDAAAGSDTSPGPIPDSANSLSPGTIRGDTGAGSVASPGSIPTTRSCATTADCNWWQEPAGLPCCAGQCANLQSDVNNCGACGQRCSANQVCAGGSCVSATAACGSVTCTGGDICCSGACVHPYNDRTNCGGCGVTCRFNGASCLVGTCCSGLDTPAPACRNQPCPAGQVLCDDGCEDLSSDPLHCGSCDRFCPGSSARCVGGLCKQ
jgi:hypothetical protein